MKIGILTFNDTNNFGSLLQTYGLYKAVLDKYGDCEIINYRCENLYNREVPKNFSQLRNLKDIYRYFKYHREQQKKYDGLCRFANENMVVSPVLTKKTISEYCKRYDKVIVGSDIVWGLDITGEDYSYFLDFLNSDEKYAYASSFGSDYILNDARRERVGELLSNFKLIAVRESDACQIVEELSGKNAQLVLDPTLLLKKSCWETKVSKRLIESPYILTYFEDNQGIVQNAALQLSKKYEKPVYNISNGRTMTGVNNVSVFSLEDFLSYIYYADFVVTASYHGMVFSIIFNKQFYFYNRCHKSRMETLSRLSELQSRELKGLAFEEDLLIDFEKVNENISRWRNISYDYLDKVVR